MHDLVIAVLERLYKSSIYSVDRNLLSKMGMKDEAVKTFTWGEQAFFKVLGHMLSCHTLKLDQPATIAPMTVGS